MTTSTGWTRQLPVLSWDLGKSDVGLHDSSLNVSVLYANSAYKNMMEHETRRGKSSHSFMLHFSVCAL